MRSQITAFPVSESHVNLESIGLIEAQFVSAGEGDRERFCHQVCVQYVHFLFNPGRTSALINIFGNMRPLRGAINFPKKPSHM